MRQLGTRDRSVGEVLGIEECEVAAVLAAAMDDA